MKRQPDKDKIDFSDILASNVVTEEDMERRLTAMSLRVVESRYLDGTASSQETTLFAKRNSRREQLELLKLEKEIALLEAKQKYILQQEQNDRLFAEAIEAMRSYRNEQNYDQSDICFFREENLS